MTARLVLGLALALAVSGEGAGEAATILTRHGFAVTVAGEHVGDAAALKYLRSIFMKSLEALVLEYASLAATVEGESIVRRSLENNLGDRSLAAAGPWLPLTHVTENA